MRSKVTITPRSVHQLKVSLQSYRPPIWRRVLVSSDINLGNLHQIIQMSMGWYDCHLHEFRVGERAFGDLSFEDLDHEDERTAILAQMAPLPKNRIHYQYDFGDSWDHLIEVEKVMEADPAMPYPVCIAGKRACPPEDCGGVWGYARLIEVLQDTGHPEHAELREWMGGPFDPELFDLALVNARLKQFR